MSTDGAYDTIGNVWEFTADWLQAPSQCGYWSSNFASGDDLTCLTGAPSTADAGVIRRGGAHFNGSDAGAFAIDAGIEISDIGDLTGFRCAR